MVRRSVIAIWSAAIAFALSASPAAAVPLGTFGHDDALDGTQREIVSGFFGGGSPTQDPLASRAPNSYETFPVVVPPGSGFGGLEATVRWQDPRLDFDIYLYRQRPDGSLRPEAVASSAEGNTTSETATYRPAISGDPVAPGTYVLVVDNWCTRNADPLAAPGGCGIVDAADRPVDVSDEDDFLGTFESLPALTTNALPSVTLAGPDAGRTTDSLSFTATATDDGAVHNYAFDLDGDGRFEFDNAQNPTVTRRFETPGAFNVGVRVTDDAGGQAYANRRLTVTAPQAPAGQVAGVSAGSSELLSGFALGRPVFGGRRGASLTVRYRLRERARVDLALYRGSRRIRTLARGVRGAAATQRVVVRSRGLKPGRYTVYLSVRTADGRERVARLSSRRL